MLLSARVMIDRFMTRAEMKWQGAGGTPGGIKHFIIGSIMAIIGGYLLLNQVIVYTGFWRLFRFGGFGISLIPFLFGIALLFIHGKSIPGWILTVAGFLVILVGIIMNMDVYFVPTSLWNTLVMLILLVGGVGLIIRSLQSLPKT
jgi:hypothetical protein